MKHLVLLAAAGADEGIIESLGKTAQDVGEQFGFNWSLFISQALSFLIVAAILYKWAYKPLLVVLEERRRKIAASLEDAARIKQELASTEEARKEILAKAGAEANKLIEEAKAAAAQVRETETQKAIAEAKSIIEKAREANTSELERMKAELRGEVVRLVAETTAKVAGKVLTEDDQKRLAEETNRQLAA